MCREGGRQRGETNDHLGSRGYSLLDDAPKGLTDTGVKYRLWWQKLSAGLRQW